MDVTDGIGYKSNLQDTLLFRALTAKGVRLRSVPGTAVIQEISRDQNKVYSLNNEWNRDSVPSTFRNKEKQWHLTRNHYHFTKNHDYELSDNGIKQKLQKRDQIKWYCR
jgi:signal peptidase I